MQSSPNIFNFKLYLLPLILVLCFFSQLVVSDTKSIGPARAITEVLATKHLSFLNHPDFSVYSRDLQQLYQQNRNQLFWLGQDRPEKNLNDALNVLSNAAADGLLAANYDAGRLRLKIQQTASFPETDIQSLAAYDVALSVSLLRFMRDLHSGQVDPRSLNYPLGFGAKSTFDFVTVLRAHADHQNIADLPLDLAPDIKQYKELKLALVDFRQQATLPPRIKLLFPKSLHPAESDQQLPELRQRLLEMGELTAEQIANVPSEFQTLYDDTTVAAVMRVQQQQGLTADGVLGKQTAALFNKTVEEKIALIELAMERLRWMPKLPQGRQILVNIPAFQLTALNSPNDEHGLHMKVVVGKYPDNQTPILWEQMRYLEFMPFWNIPKSILDKEISPKMRTSGNYLSTQQIELIENSSVEEEIDADGNVISIVKHGAVRARQRPGDKNPLGRVKFIFPNKADVYMHDTPAHGAFNRDRRDLSHGCVRVAEADKLAEFVLEEEVGWNKEAIAQAMSAQKTQRVSLKKSIPVMFFYSTAFVGQDHRTQFYPDIYGYDEVLRGAISKTNSKILAVKAPNNNG